ncbi:MAG: hypothetical protein AB9M53_09860 [Leptothrix sp. (in: b-proteobacteria)]
MVYLWKTHFGRHDSTTVELSQHQQGIGRTAGPGAWLALVTW